MRKNEAPADGGGASLVRNKRAICRWRDLAFGDIGGSRLCSLGFRSSDCRLNGLDTRFTLVNGARLEGAHGQGVEPGRAWQSKRGWIHSHPLNLGRPQRPPLAFVRLGALVHEADAATRDAIRVCWALFRRNTARATGCDARGA